MALSSLIEPAFVSFVVPTLAALSMLAFHAVIRFGSDSEPHAAGAPAKPRIIPTAGRNIPGAGQ